MRIEVWSDVACPWCWLGKAHLDAALREVGVEADVRLRSFELDPRRVGTRPARQHVIEKYGSIAFVDAAQARLEAAGAAAGIRFDFARALAANTFDAHRLHHFAIARGAGAAMADRLFRAYHAEGADVSDHATLRALAAEMGLPRDEVDAMLAGDAYAEDVRADERAAQAIGFGGVPFFVIGRYAVSGAQPVETFVKVLRMAMAAEAT